MKLVNLALVFLFMVSGCAQIELRTAWALRNVDFLSVDPGVMRLAFSLPDGAVLDKATLELQFSRNEEFENRS